MSKTGVTNARITLSANSTEYRKQMDLAVRQLREISAEYGVAAAEARAFGSASDSLKISAQELTAKIDAQKNIVKLNTEEHQALSEELDKQRKNSADIKKQLDETVKAYEKSRESTGKNSEETQKLDEKVKELKKSYADSADTVQRYEDKLSKQKTATDKSKTALANMKGELKKVNEEMARAPWDKFAAGAQKVSDISGRLGRSLSIVSGGIVTGGTAAVKSAIDYESAFAGVRKTVDATEEELAALSGGIRQMATEIPATTTEIASVAEAAGQLGIHKDKILDFSRVMLDLGVSTNLSSSEAASSLAKFANVTQMSADDYSKLGSVIVSLGNKFATTEADIVSMGTRLASSGEIVGLTEPQIMAVSTALSSVGIEAEAGGSAVSKLVKQISTSVSVYDAARSTVHSTGKSLRELELMSSHDSAGFKSIAAGLGLTVTELKNSMSQVSALEGFADVAGVSADEFISAWGKDAVSALDMFISGLSDTERTGKSAVEILEGMGLTEVRLSNAILALSTSGGILTDAVNAANTAWEENNALSNEASQRYGTNASRLTTLKNRISEVAIQFGEHMLPTFERVLDKVESLVSKFSGLSDRQKDVAVKTAAVGAAAGPCLMAFSKLSGAAGSLAQFIGAVSGKIAGAGGLTSAIGAIANPVTLVVAALAAFGIGLASVYKNNEQVRSSVNAAAAGIRDSLKPALEFFTGTVLPDCSAAWNKLLEILRPLGSFVSGVFTDAWNQMIVPTMEWLGSKGIPKATETFQNLWNKVLKPMGSFLAQIFGPAIKAVSAAFEWLWKNIILPLSQFMKDQFQTRFEGLCGILNKVVIPAVGGVITIFDKLRATASKIWDKINDWIVEPIKKAIGKVKEFFNVDLKFKGIKLPHISIEWDTEGLIADAAKLLGLKGVPKFEVKWYAKGGIMQQPTLFGAFGNTLFGGGEAGDEAILPLDAFYNRLDGLLTSRFEAYAAALKTVVNVRVILDGKVIAEYTADKVQDLITVDLKKRR